VARQRPIYIPDNYTLLLLAVVVLATLLPARGIGASILQVITNAAITLLFFLHGMRLSREAIVAGLVHWRLHLIIFSCTFVLFPVLGVAFEPAYLAFVPQQLYQGILYLCFLPSTVQSAIALTSIARGNISAAVCAASSSTIVGVFLTPFLVEAWVAPAEGDLAIWESIARIMLQLVVPFLVGHLLRPILLKWMARTGPLVMLVDRGSILLVVYTAFSAAVLQGIWQQVSAGAVVALMAISLVLLALSLGYTWFVARSLGLNRADQITTMMAGSQKSLASGLPMAQVLFPNPVVGIMVLPLMVYHQIQLMACAVLAQRWGEKSAASATQN